MGKNEQLVLQKELLEKYKTFLRHTKNDAEAYKWLAVETFQQHWDIDADDFTAMVKLAFSKIGNLLYQNSLGFLDKAAIHFPKAMKKMFIELYDESIMLESRVGAFQKAAEELLPNLKKKLKRENLNHQQDERTLSVYLSLKYPEKYFIFKNSYYQAYCSLIGETTKPAGQKLLHYQDLAEQFKQQVVLKDPELIELHKELNSVYSWNDSNLIVQNLLFTMLEPKGITFIIANITWNSNDWKEPSHDKSGHKWVTGGGQPHESWNFDFENPRNTDEKIYGFIQVTNPPKVGGTNNLVIFYSLDKIVGFYGKAEVLPTPEDLNSDESYNLIGDKNLSICLTNKIDEAKAKGYLEGKERVGQIGFNYIRKLDTVNKILDEAVALNPDQAPKLQTIKIWVNSGTLSDDSLSELELITKLKYIGDRSKIEQFFSLLSHVVKEFGLTNDDKRISFSTPSNNDRRISATIGQRYIISLEKKVIASSSGIELALLASKDDESLFRQSSGFKEFGEFKGHSPHEIAPYYAYYNENVFPLKSQLIEAWLKATENELTRTEKSSYRQYHNPLYFKAVVDNEYREYVLNKIFKPTNKMEDFPLNQIFFGPPGTGKTYNTINKSLEIIGENLDGLTRKQIMELFEKKMKEGQIVFTTFHQSMSYEDFIEGIKPCEPEKEGDPVIYRIELGIFRNLCIEASFLIAQLRESRATEEVLDFSILYDHFAENVDEKILNGKKVELKTKTGGTVIVDSISQQGNFIIKHHDDTRTYTVSKTRLTKLHSAIKELDDVSNINDKFREIIGGSNSSAYWAVLNAIKKEKPSKILTKENRNYTFTEKKDVVLSLSNTDFKNKVGKPYVMIIDEINRGNISQIFGELITLIEKDKRLGSDEALEVILPYSKEKFGVPPNLFIIGTMNTADRSIEAMDTALRRRFIFHEMPSDPQLIKEVGKSGGTIDGIDLVIMLGTINRRIEKLLDKDHQIGHSYLLDVSNLEELKSAFKDQVIPLLEEYFYGSFWKIGLVLGEKFVVTKNGDPKDFTFAKFKGFDEDTISDLSERKMYQITGPSDWNPETFISIYQ